MIQVSRSHEHGVFMQLINPLYKISIDFSTPAIHAEVHPGDEANVIWLRFLPD
jgi:hypothetical protein